MSEIYWKVAETMRELDEAQRVRWACLREELGIRARDVSALRRDVSALDALPNVHHILVYCGEEAVGTARLTQADTDVARATGSRYGFELEAHVDLSTLDLPGAELGEISRLCVRRRHAARAAARLYEGLYAQSRNLGIRFWLGGVDCATSEADDARRVCEVLERNDLVSLERVVHAKPAGGDAGDDEASPVSAGHGEASDDDPCDSAPGDHDPADSALPALPHALGAFIRRLNARAIGRPVRHPHFERFIIPMVADVRALPAATLALFDASVTAGFAVPRDAWARLARTAHESLRRLDQHPVGRALIDGSLPREPYMALLVQIVHQVQLSAPMLARAAERLDELGRRRLAAIFRRKGSEEDGHDAWALQDLSALGMCREAALAIPCCSAVQAYSAWLRHCAEAAPTAVLGLAFTLEWFGSARAGRAATNLVRRASIAGIESAVRFLAGHGAADDEHLRAFAEPFAEITSPDEIDAILLSARLTADLYLSMLDFAGAAPTHGDVRRQPLFRAEERGSRSEGMYLAAARGA